MTTSRKRFLIITMTLICAFLIYQACTKKTVVAPKRSANVNNAPTYSTVYETVSTGGGGTGGGGVVVENGLAAPNNLNIAKSIPYGVGYVADYFSMLNEVSGGIANFWFYGKSNGNPYPTGEFETTKDGYATIDLPSHGVTIHGDSYGVIVKVRYKIKDSNGNVVMYLHDTKGGYHGNYGGNLRGNNHPNHSQRYLPFGTYTIELENLSDANVNVPISFNFGRAGGNLTEFFGETVNSGESMTKTFEIFSSTSTFKLNCNFY